MTESIAVGDCHFRKRVDFAIHIDVKGVLEMTDN